MNSKKNFKKTIELVHDAEQLLKVGAEKGRLSVIERDILLEKLRACYELILFERVNEDTQSMQHSQSIKHETVIAPPKQPEVASTVIETASKPSNLEMVNSGTEPLAELDEKELKKGRVEARESEKITKNNDFKPDAIIDDSPSEEKTEELEFVESEPTISEDIVVDIEPNKGKTTLAERYQGTKKFRNETLGNGKKDVASVLKGKPISDLTKAIGINDKFLFTKELFAGNAGLYSKTIKTLNEFDSINDAIIYIEDNFSWNNDNEAANQLIELVRRKLLHD